MFYLQRPMAAHALRSDQQLNFSRVSKCTHVLQILASAEVPLTFPRTEDITSHQAPGTTRHRPHRSEYRVRPGLKITNYK